MQTSDLLVWYNWQVRTIIRKSSHTYSFFSKGEGFYRENSLRNFQSETNTKQLVLPSHLSYQHTSAIQRKSTLLPLRILHFLGDVVECVPSWVGEEGRVESQSNHPWVCCRALEWSFQVFCFSRWISGHWRGTPGGMVLSGMLCPTKVLLKIKGGDLLSFQNSPLV